MQPIKPEVLKKLKQPHSRNDSVSLKNQRNMLKIYLNSTKNKIQLPPLKIPN